MRSLAVAALLAIALLFATRQITPTHWYAEYGAYRAQVDALLQGRMALSEAPDALAHDLAWTEHGVQQVWGLGVPLLQLPFELLGRAVGISPFPDRVALLAWFVLVFFVALRAWPGAKPAAIGSVVIAVLLPGFVTMLRGRSEVYEEAATYAYTSAILLLAGLTCFARAPTRTKYWLLVGAAGLTGLIRPTVWFYGLATSVIASGVWLKFKGRSGLPHVAIAIALFVAGGGVLYGTNARRFGAGSEFGHRLNVQALPGSIVSTRFGYPFAHLDTMDAAEELIGSLFDRPEQHSKGGYFQSHLHRGQSNLVRWREYYFTTYSWSYGPILLAGLVIGALALRKRGPQLHLWLFAVLGGVPLFVFYLHSPSVSSRYQLDLAPAFAALILIVWQALVARFHPRAMLGVLAVAWGIAIATSLPNRPHILIEPVGRDAAAAATWRFSRELASLHHLPDNYDLTDPTLPSWTESREPFDRCRDELGAAISCAATPLPGDVHVHGVRNERTWRVTTDTIAEPVTCELDSEPVCRAAPTVLDNPDRVRTGLFFSEDTLYDNGALWDLVTGVVPSATFFYTQDPAFVEVDVDHHVPSDDYLTEWDHAVRVNVGLHHLQLASAALTGHGARLRFEAAPGDHLPSGFQVVFLAFGSDGELAETPSDYLLKRVRLR